MTEQTFDLAVLGAGPGGYVAAIRAAQLGMKTVVIEREHLGGVCLNWGCIPTKTLLRTSEIYHTLHHLNDFGLVAKDVGYDAKMVVARSRKVAEQLSEGVEFLLRKNKVTVIYGVGKLAGKGKIAVTTEGEHAADVVAKHIVLATGARPRLPPGLEPDGELIWTCKEAMIPPSIPKSILVVGSGAIGVEFASFYRTMGTEVTVVEVLERVLPVEDEEVSAFARKQFERQGMKILTSAKATKLEKGKETVTATVEQDGQKTKLIVERVISAVGITGNVENIGLEGTGVKVEKGHVVVDEWLRTGEPHVYAIGDLVGPPWLAHKASHEGVICVEKIAGLDHVQPLNVQNVPGCTYCMPQIASVGLTEAKAKESGRTVKVGRFPYVGNGKAIALGEPEGFVKTVFDAETGELLGAHMVGVEVTELIQGFTIAKTLETTESELMETIFPHPTLSEMMHESVLDADGRAIHF